MEEWNGNSLQGCLFSADNAAAPLMSFASHAPLSSDASLPRSVDLRPHCTPVEDQGRCNSCTANAVVGAMEYHLAKRDGRVTDLSRLFVYFNTRRLNGAFNMDIGATIPQAMASALAFGACRAALWPYDLSRLNVHPPAEAYKDAMGHEALQFARAGGVEGAVRALADGLPVAFGANLPKRCYDEAARTGRMPLTTAAERANKPNFGHAMLLVGYDLPSREFILRNSWGPNWGDGGYARIAFDDLEHCAPKDQFWTLAQMEPAQNFRISKPAASLNAEVDISAAAPTAVFGAAALAAPNDGRSPAERLRAEIRGEIESGQQALSDKISNLRASLRGGGDQAATPASNPAPGAALSGQMTETPAGELRAEDDPGVICPAPADSPYPVVAAEEYPPGMEIKKAETRCVICFGSGRCEMCDGASASCVWCMDNPGVCRTCKGMKRIVLILPVRGKDKP